PEGDQGATGPVGLRREPGLPGGVAFVLPASVRGAESMAEVVGPAEAVGGTRFRGEAGRTAGPGGGASGGRAHPQSTGKTERPPAGLPGGGRGSGGDEQPGGAGF